MIIMNMLMMMIKRALRSRPVCAVEKANEETHTLMNAIEVSKMVFGNSLNCLQHFCFGPLQNRPKNEGQAPPEFGNLGGGLPLNFRMVWCAVFGSPGLRPSGAFWRACLAPFGPPGVVLGLSWASPGRLGCSEGPPGSLFCCARFEFASF